MNFAGVSLMRGPKRPSRYSFSWILLLSSPVVAGKLHEAVKVDDIAKVEALIASGADANRSNLSLDRHVLRKIDENCFGHGPARQDGTESCRRFALPKRWLLIAEFAFLKSGSKNKLR